MAALRGGLLSLGSAAGRQLLPVPTFNATAVRLASKKTGGSTKNRGGNRTGKRLGFKKIDVFLNLSNFKLCGLAGEFWELKSTHLKVAEVEKHSSKGQFVHAGNILATQRVIRWHPGAHVGMGYNKWLYALEDGIVRFTKEVYVPPARGKESREVICQLPKGAVLYKTFINVVPTEEVGSFKLITMI